MLIEPVALSDFFLSFFSAAMIILLAALYAALFAWSKISPKKRLTYFLWLVYAALLSCIGVFSQINHFNNHWMALSLLMAAGYGGMPYLIWRLCTATHNDDTEH